MSVPFNPIITGTFTSNGTSQLITVPSDIVKLEMYDLTYFGSTAATSTEEIATWVRGLPAGAAYVGNKTNAAATIAITSMISTNGFTFLDPTVSQLQNAITGTAVSQANPAAVAMVAHGYNTGDVIRITQTTGMFQIAGMDFTVTNTGANTFNLTNLNSSGFAAAATNIVGQKLNYGAAFYPVNRTITNISAAASARVTMSVTHGFTIGQLVRIIVPAGWGMSQMNGLLGTITNIGQADASGYTNTIDININSSAFTAFSFPTSAAAGAGIGFPQVVPVGEAATSPFQNLLDDATVNQSSFQMQFGSSVVGANNDLIRWIAYRGFS
jgi:hypothetical protein